MKKITSVNHVAHSSCSVKAVMIDLSSRNKRKVGSSPAPWLYNPIQPTGKPHAGTWGNLKLWIPRMATCGHHGDIWLQDLALIYATCQLPRTPGLPQSRVYLAASGGQGFSAWWHSESNPAPFLSEKRDTFPGVTAHTSNSDGRVAFTS